MSKESRQAVRAVFLAAIMVISVFAGGVAFSGSAAANHDDSDVIVVDDDFSTTNETHKKSIQAAVDNAGAQDTIEVRAGTYEESINVDVQGLTIEGPNAGIEYNGARNDEAKVRPPEGADAFQIKADNVEVSGFDIKIEASSLGTNALYVTSNSDTISGEATIRNNIVTATGDVDEGINGVFIPAENGGPGTPNDVVIEGNEFNLTGAGNGNSGVNIVPTNDGTRGEIELSGNKIVSDPGQVKDADNLVIEENIFIIGDASGLQYGTSLDLGGIGESTISDNEFESADDAPEFVQVGDDSVELGPILNGNTFDGAVTIRDDAGSITGDRIFAAIQPAVNVAADGATISVGPGTYNESAAIPDGNSEVGLYVGTPDLTIQGVDSSGDPITDRENVQAHIISEEGTSWGTNGVYVDAPGTTVTGLEFSPDPNADPNKNFEIVEDDFTLRDSIINGNSGSSIYFNTGNVQSFAVSDSNITGTISFNNGVGNETPAQNRIVENNRINTINFQGTNPAPWLNYPIGDVQIENNDVVGSVIASGDVAVNFQELVDNNEFPEGYVIVRNEQGDILSTEQVAQQSVSGFGEGDRIRINRRTIFTSISEAITEAKERPQYVDDSGNPITTIGPENGQTSDTVEVGPGIYNESVDIDVQGLTLEGPNAGTRGYESRPSAEAVIEQGVVISADDVTLDGFEVTNNGGNGIKIADAPSNVVVTNNRVVDIAGGTAGNQKAFANGINLQFNDAFENTSSGIEITNNEVHNITTEDMDVGSNDVIGIQLLPRGNDVEDLRIADNVISDIEAGDASDAGRAEARGVSIDTQFIDEANGDTRGDFGQAKNLTIEDNEIRSLSSEYSRAISLFEDTGGSSSNRGTPIGPVNFTIRRNTIDDLTSADPAGNVDAQSTALFIGGYGNLGDEHQFIANNVEEGAVSRLLYGQVEPPESADLLDAGENWWGNEDGPRVSSSSGTVGRVATAPFLTVPYQQVETGDEGTPRQFATELELTGGVNTIAFPAPSERTLNESLNTSNVEAVYVYDNSEQSWLVSGDGDDGTFNSSVEPDALDVYVVVVEEGETASLVMEFDNDFDPDATQLGTTEVSGGWNLVSPSQAADTADGAYATRNAEVELTSENPFQSPRRQPFDADDAEFSPYRGYWTFVDEDDGTSEVASSNFEGLTLLDFIENVNLPPEDN